MSYAQKDFKDQLGTGPYTIATAGCFVAAFSNLLMNKFGIDVNPSSLNGFFKSHGAYINQDLLAWGSISSYNGQIHVVKVGSGWPDEENAIVKFVYRAHNGAEITHFCSLADAKSHLITDSYDAVAKKSPYGDPVAYAVYDFTGPHNVPAYTPPASSPASSFVEWHGKVTALMTCQVRASATSKSKGNLGNINSDGLLHSGDVFDVVGYQWGEDPYGNGKHFWLKTARGNWVYAYATNFFSIPGHGAGDPVDDQVHDAVIPDEPLPVTSDSVTYTRFPQPVQLVTTHPQTPMLDFSVGDKAAVVGLLNPGVAFVAVGKAQRTDDPGKTVFFMNAEDFGDADKTGVPVRTFGINTVHLGDNGDAVDAASANEGSVPVRVVPPDPNKFKQTYTKYANPISYVALESAIIEDGGGEFPPVELNAGQVIRVAGSFKKDGVEYLRSVHSEKNSIWYGVPVGIAERKVVEADEDISQIGANILADAKREAEIAKAHHRAASEVATIEGLPARVINFFRKGRK